MFHAGQRPRWIFYVMAGELRLVRHSSTGNEIILQRQRAGFLAEASLWSGRYHCDGIAVETGDAMAFPIKPFQQALQQDAHFQESWMRYLATAVRRTRAQAERLSLHSAADRITHYIESEGENGSVNLTHTRKAWAAELGLSHEALYRTLARLQDIGFLVVEKNQIRLAQPRCARLED